MPGENPIPNYPYEQPLLHYYTNPAVNLDHAVKARQQVAARVICQFGEETTKLVTTWSFPWSH